MTGSARQLRVVILATIVAVAAVWTAADRLGGSASGPDVGTAAVAVGAAPARAVEEVAYRQDVTRVGDLLLVDGTPVEEPTDPRIVEVWEIVASIWPDQLAEELVQISVVEEESRGLVGVVHAANAGGWILSLDVADLDDRRLVVETIVHEISHVVTLAPEVFTFGDTGSCEGVQVSLGCAAAGSVLAEFASTFWPDPLAVDLQRTADGAAFVNDYAMTAAHEDLAETFTAWVLDWPVAGGAVDAKVAQLAADPALSRLATDLRAVVGEAAAPAR